MEAASRGDRDVRPDRIPRQLVPEAHVLRIDLEQLPAFRLLRGRRPLGHHGVQHRRGDAVRHDADELHEVPVFLGKPRHASSNRVRDRGRQLVGGAGGEQLGHVERVASGRGIHVARTIAGERRHRALRKRREREEHRVVGTRRADGGVHRMIPRRLTVPAGEQEQDGKRADPPRQHGDHVECRFVRPVHVLDHEYGRLRRQRQLRQQQPVDLVRSDVGGERLLERRRDASRKVVDRSQRSRNRQVVARTEEHSGPGLEIAHEALDEGCLADSRLSGDHDDTTVAPRCRIARLGKRGQSAIPLEQLHRPTIDLWSPVGKTPIDAPTPRSEPCAQTSFPVPPSRITS